MRFVLHCYTDSLQWGRSRTTAEMEVVTLNSTSLWPASMGPQSYDCGNEIEVVVGGPGSLASMGPQSYDCGNAGAVVFACVKGLMLQWGRSRTTAEMATGSGTITIRATLQWGRSRTTAEMRSGHRPQTRPRTASMGPQSYDCGNGSECHESDGFTHGFNGAAVVRLRKCRGQYAITVERPVASMGPQSYDCGNASK